MQVHENYSVRENILTLVNFVISEVCIYLQRQEEDLENDAEEVVEEMCKRW